MSAFNARLRPKVWFGLPAYTVGGLFISLPSFIIATMTEALYFQILLWILSALSLLLAVIFLVLGNQAQFIGTVIMSMRENNNVTSETWTRW